jgi:hypothetical protein
MAESPPLPPPSIPEEEKKNNIPSHGDIRDGKLYVTTVMQPTLKWAYNDKEPENYKGTLFTPDEKKAFADDWSSGKLKLPYVYEHAGMKGAEETPDDKIIGHTIGAMVDGDYNLIGLGELDLSRPEVKRMYEDIELSRVDPNPAEKRPWQWGSSLYTLLYPDGHKEVRHVGATKNPAFGDDGSWHKDYGVEAPTFRDRIRKNYLSDPRMYVPASLRERFKDSESTDPQAILELRKRKEEAAMAIKTATPKSISKKNIGGQSFPLAVLASDTLPGEEIQEAKIAEESEKSISVPPPSQPAPPSQNNNTISTPPPPSSSPSVISLPKKIMSGSGDSSGTGQAAPSDIPVPSSSQQQAPSPPSQPRHIPPEPPFVSQRGRSDQFSSQTQAPSFARLPDKSVEVQLPLSLPPASPLAAITKRIWCDPANITQRRAEIDRLPNPHAKMQHLQELKNNISAEQKELNLGFDDGMEEVSPHIKEINNGIKALNTMLLNEVGALRTEGVIDPETESAFHAELTRSRTDPLSSRLIHVAAASAEKAARSQKKMEQEIAAKHQLRSQFDSLAMEKKIADDTNNELKRSYETSMGSMRAEMETVKRRAIEMEEKMTHLFPLAVTQTTGAQQPVAAAASGNYGSTLLPTPPSRAPAASLTPVAPGSAADAAMSNSGRQIFSKRDMPWIGEGDEPIAVLASDSLDEVDMSEKGVSQTGTFGSLAFRLKNLAKAQDPRGMAGNRKMITQIHEPEGNWVGDIKTYGTVYRGGGEKQCFIPSRWTAKYEGKEEAKHNPILSFQSGKSYQAYLGR